MNAIYRSFTVYDSGYFSCCLRWYHNRHRLNRLRNGSVLKLSLSQPVILVRFSPGLIHRILGLILTHLFIDNFIFVQVQFVQHISAIHQHVRQFLPDVGHIILRIAPLETFQQLISLNGDRLRQIGRRMEFPVSWFPPNDLKESLTRPIMFRHF